MLGFVPMLDIVWRAGVGPIQLAILGLFAILFAQVAYGVSASCSNRSNRPDAVRALTFSF
jgi:membrane glycosyltransferase